MSAYVERNRDFARQISRASLKDVQVINQLQAGDGAVGEWKPLAQSAHAKATINPIRRICDAMAVPPNPNKSLIKLHLGDPTLTGKLLPSETVTKALHDAVSGHKYDGYGPAVGDLAARQAVVDKYSCPAASFQADDVILASGGSHAIQMCLEAIANPGDNILYPNPGFPLYSTICGGLKIEDRPYRLDMRKGGQIDLCDLESQIDSRTRAIIVNNPSNPTGVVFSKRHLEDVLRVANKYRIPIISDEIYGDLTYDGAKFYPLATLSPRVPILTCDGIAKRYLVPGWRMGWIIVHDRFGVLADIKKGIVSLSQKIVGPCALVQGALPTILRDTPDSFFDNIKTVLANNARIVFNQLSKVPGLTPLRPHGAMYMMVNIDKRYYGEETAFIQNLIREQSVFCLPGSAFSAPGWFRLVLTYPEEVTMDACERIREFCEQNAQVNEELVSEPIGDDEGCNSSDEGLDFDSSSGADESEDRCYSPFP